MEKYCLVSKGWQISVNALFGLWEDLQKSGFNYILTSRLNQDCLENLFSIIRCKGGFRDNPNSEQFRATFRHVVVDKLFVQSKLSNCQIDCDKVSLDVSSLTIYQKKNKPANNPQVFSDITGSMTIATPELSLPEKNIAAYIAGYLLRKYPIDNCDFLLSVFSRNKFTRKL